MTEVALTLPATLVLKDEWRQAIDLWLNSRNVPTTRRSYAAALQDLITSTGRLPWEVSRTDVTRWTLDLKNRGLAPATIAARVAGVRSFFKFCMEEYLVTGPDGRQVPLHTNNPALGKSMRPRIEMYGKAAWLSAEESKALLRAVAQAGDVRSKRNFALFLGYILLARRSSEWRVARWGDFENHGNRVYYRWAGKGKVDQRLEVPLPLWNAVGEYLDADLRLDKIQPYEYIFSSLRAELRIPAGRLITPGDGPISGHEVGRILKAYCRQAGLDPEKIHVHSLRHTGAMLRRKAGASPEEVMEYLGHANLAVTTIYLHKLAGKSDQSWATVAEMLGLEEEPKKGVLSSDKVSYRMIAAKKRKSEAKK
jgi:integrase